LLLRESPSSLGWEAEPYRSIPRRGEIPHPEIVIQTIQLFTMPGKKTVLFPGIQKKDN
jgi:hypothetical protein